MTAEELEDLKNHLKNTTRQLGRYTHAIKQLERYPSSPACQSYLNNVHDETELMVEILIDRLKQLIQRQDRGH